MVAARERERRGERERTKERWRERERERERERDVARWEPPPLPPFSLPHPVRHPTFLSHFCPFPPLSLPLSPSLSLPPSPSLPLSLSLSLYPSLSIPLSPLLSRCCGDGAWAQMVAALKVTNPDEVVASIFALYRYFPFTHAKDSVPNVYLTDACERQ